MKKQAMVLLPALVAGVVTMLPLRAAASDSLLQGAWAPTFARNGFVIPDLDTLRETAVNSGPGRVWETPELQRWLETALAKADAEDHALKDRLLEALDELDGPVVLFDPSPEGAMPTAIDQTELCLVARMGEKLQEMFDERTDDIAEFFEIDATIARRSSETYLGHEIHSMTGTRTAETMRYLAEGQSMPTFDGDMESFNDYMTWFDMVEHEVPVGYSWVIEDDFFCFCSGPVDHVRNTLQGLHDDNGAGGLFESVAWGDVHAATGTADFPIVGWSNVGANLAAGARNMPIDFDQVDSVLNLTGFGLGIAAATFDDEGIDVRFGVTLPRSKSGLTALLLAGDTNTFRLAGVAPRDAVMFVGWTLDMKPFWSELRRTFRAMSPEMDNALEGGLMTMRLEMEFNLETEVLNRIAGEHAVFTTPGDDGTDITSIISVTDGLGMQAAMDRLLTKLVEEPYQLPVERSEQDGVPIWHPREDPDMMIPPIPPIAFGPTAVVTAPMARVRDTLRRLGGGEAGDSLASSAEFREALDRLAMRHPRLVVFMSASMMSPELGGDEDFEEFADMIGTFLGDDLGEATPPPSWWRRHFGWSAYGIESDGRFLVGKSYSIMR